MLYVREMVTLVYQENVNVINFVKRTLRFFHHHITRKDTLISKT